MVSASLIFDDSDIEMVYHHFLNIQLTFTLEFAFLMKDVYSSMQRSFTSVHSFYRINGHINKIKKSSFLASIQFELLEMRSSYFFCPVFFRVAISLNGPEIFQ